MIAGLLLALQLVMPASFLTVKSPDRESRIPVVVNAGIMDLSHGGGGTSLTVNAGATAVIGEVQRHRCGATRQGLR